MLKKTKIMVALLLFVTLIVAENMSFDVIRKDGALTLPDEVVKSEVLSVLDIQDLNAYCDIYVNVYADYYVAYLFSATTYESFCFKIEKNRNGSFRVAENYQEAQEEYCGSCPDETIEVVVGSCFRSASHPARTYPKKAYEALKAGGVKAKLLEGTAENRKSVLDWLSCKNVKLWGRIGHGMSNGQISFAGSRQGNLTPSDIAKVDLKHKYMIINSCFIHNSRMIPSMMDKANAYFFCAGNNKTLPMQTSEPQWLKIVTDGVMKDGEFGALLDKAMKTGGGRNYGYTRSKDAVEGKCFWKDVQGSIQMKLSYPNGGEKFKNGDKVSIKWTTNSQKTVSIKLFQNTTEVKTIEASASNTGSYDWTIPADLKSAKDYKIKVSVESIDDMSDNTFEIEAATNIQNAAHTFNSFSVRQHGSNVSYHIPSDQFVSLQLFNQNGRLIQKLEKSEKVSGKYSFSLVELNLTSGIYILKMNTPNFSKSISIIHNN